MNVPLRRALLVWLLLMAAEVVHGILRRIFLVPVIGDLAARQVGVFTGSALIVAITTVTIRWLRPSSTQALFVIGTAWTVLTFGFEIVFGLVSGASWERIASDYDVANGGLMPIGLGIEFISPYIAARLRPAPPTAI